MIKNRINKKYCILTIIILFIIVIPTSSFAISNQYKFNKLEKKDIDHYLSYQNTPPNPPIIEGPQTGKHGKTYEYSFTLTDPDEDDILTILEVDFGDEITGVVKKNCEKPWLNGTIIYMLQSWNEDGEYKITARVLDVYGDWSNWSKPFEVSIHKSKSYQNLLNECFPLLFKILFFIKDFN